MRSFFDWLVPEVDVTRALTKENSRLAARYRQIKMHHVIGNDGGERFVSVGRDGKNIVVRAGYDEPCGLSMDHTGTISEEELRSLLSGFIKAKGREIAIPVRDYLKDSADTGITEELEETIGLVRGEVPRVLAVLDSI